MQIVGVWPVFDNLLIAMADSRWYRYTFTDDPDFGEIRYIGTKIIPDFAVTAATTGSPVLRACGGGGRRAAPRHRLCRRGGAGAGAAGFGQRRDAQRRGLEEG